jgi:spore coat protein U-like protein
MYTITGTSSSLEHAKKAGFNCCVSLGKLSNLSVAEHISFSAFSSVISHGAGNFIHTISVEIKINTDYSVFLFSDKRNKKQTNSMA